MGQSKEHVFKHKTISGSIRTLRFTGCSCMRVRLENLIVPTHLHNSPEDIKIFLKSRNVIVDKIIVTEEAV